MNHKKDLCNLYAGSYRSFLKVRKCLLLTHAAVDHCGLVDVFAEIILSCRSATSYENKAKAPLLQDRGPLLGKGRIGKWPVMRSY